VAGISLPYPERGLNDSFAHSDQPLLTTRDEENMRPIEAATNRRRGSQRAGSSLYCSERLGIGGKVQAVAQVTYDARATTYSHKSTANPGDMTVWAFLLSNAVD
jgi:hypothetical protein